MRSSNSLLFWIGMLAVMIRALWCVIAPSSVVAWRKRIGFSESVWSGGYFYATASRARQVGILFCILMAVVLFKKIFG